MTNKSEIHRAALAYAGTGYPVLPVLPVQKKPACPHGVKDATLDPPRLDPWFAGRPDLNLGIATGPGSGLLVVDVDPKNGGRESFERLALKIGSLDSAPQVATPSGGRHYYLRFPDGGGLRTNIPEFPGIDFQGAGRYVLAPPSQIGDASYRWIGPGVLEMRAPPTPEALVELLRNTAAVASREPVFDSAGLIAEGGRNNELVRVAGSLRRQGLDVPEILETLLAVNARQCRPPLPEEEVREIAQSIGRYPAGKRFENSDLGNAKRLVERFGADIRYCKIWKKWLIWSGKRWEIDETGEVERMAKKVAEAILLEAEMLEKGIQNGT